jgi:hypothetical protein
MQLQWRVPVLWLPPLVLPLANLHGVMVGVVFAVLWCLVWYFSYSGSVCIFDVAIDFDFLSECIPDAEKYMDQRAKKVAAVTTLNNTV